MKGLGYLEGQRGHACSLAMPSKGPRALWKEAGICPGIGKAWQMPNGMYPGPSPDKAWQKPQGILEGTGATPGPQQIQAKAPELSGGQQGPDQTPANSREDPGFSGGQQGPCWAPAKPGKGPRACWGEAGLFLAQGKVRRRHQGTLQSSRTPDQPLQSSAKTQRHSGRQQDPLRAMAKPSKGSSTFWRKAWPCLHPGKIW